MKESLTKLITMNNKEIHGLSLNMAVFTTKYVMGKNSPIVYVYYDEEGDWQFFGSEENIEIEDAMVVSLGEIFEMDRSIVDVLTLAINSFATRKSRNSDWVVSTL